MIFIHGSPFTSPFYTESDTVSAPHKPGATSSWFWTSQEAVNISFSARRCLLLGPWLFSWESIDQHLAEHPLLYLQVKNECLLLTATHMGDAQGMAGSRSILGFLPKTKLKYKPLKFSRTVFYTLERSHCTGGNPVCSTETQDSGIHKI